MYQRNSIKCVIWFNLAAACLFSSHAFALSWWVNTLADAHPLPCFCTQQNIPQPMVAGYVLDPVHGTSTGTTTDGVPVVIVQSDANGGQSARVPYLKIDQKYYSFAGTTTVYSHLLIVTGTAINTCTLPGGGPLTQTGSSMALDSGAFIPITGGAILHCTTQWCVQSFTTANGNATCDSAIPAPQIDILFRNGFERKPDLIFANGF